MSGRQSNGLKKCQIVYFHVVSCHAWLNALGTDQFNRLPYLIYQYLLNESYVAVFC